MTPEGFPLKLKGLVHIAGHGSRGRTTAMVRTYSRKHLQSAPAVSEYCLTDFKQFKVLPKINAGQADLSLYMLEMSSLNRQVLEEFHRRYLLSFVRAGRPSAR